MFLQWVTDIFFLQARAWVSPFPAAEGFWSSQRRGSWTKKGAGSESSAVRTSEEILGGNTRRTRTCPPTSWGRNKTGIHGEIFYAKTRVWVAFSTDALWACLQRAGGDCVTSPKSVCGGARVSVHLSTSINSSPPSPTTRGSKIHHFLIPEK